MATIGSAPRVFKPSKFKGRLRKGREPASHRQSRIAKEKKAFDAETKRLTAKAKAGAKPKKVIKGKLGTRAQAFAAARKAGKKEFTWKGNPYHTRTAEEEAKTASDAKAAKATKPKTSVNPRTRKTQPTGALRKSPDGSTVIGGHRGRMLEKKRREKEADEKKKEKPPIPRIEVPNTVLKRGGTVKKKGLARGGTVARGARKGKYGFRP